MANKKKNETKKSYDNLIQKMQNASDSLPPNIQALIHELQAYHVELETQNETLREAQQEIEAIKVRYADLYDFAPVGYLTVNDKNTIVEANRTIGLMLDIAHSELVESQFTDFFFSADQDSYYPYFRQLLNTGEAQHRELRLVKSDGSHFWARLEGAPAKNDEGTITECRIIVSDISDYKQMEESLQQHDQKLQTLFNVLPIGISIIDENRQIIEINPALERILGLSMSELRAGKHGKRKYIHSDGTPYQAGEFPSDYAIESNEATYDNEIGIINEGGKTIWVSVNAIPFVNDTAQVVLAITDITERKKVEQKLWHKQNIIANMRDGVALVNHNFEYEIANDTYISHTGLQCHDLEGYKVADIFGTEQFEAYIKPRLLRSFQGETVQIEDWYAVPDVGQKYLNINYLLYQDEVNGDITGVIITIFDLTDHKNTEDDLEEQYAILDRFFAVSPDLLIISDNEAIISRVSKASETILGYSAEELEGSNYRDLIHPDDQERGRITRTKLKYQTKLLNYVNRYRNKSGDYRTLEWSVYHDRVGEFYYCAARDITERIQMQSTLRENEANLTALIENIDGYIWSIDTNYNLIVVNSAFKTILREQYNIEYKTGANVLSPPLAQEAERAEWKQYYDRALAGEAFRLERSSPAAARITEFRFSPIHDVNEQIVGVTIFGQDITDRKNMENKLRASEARYRTVMNNFPNGVLALYDLDMRFTLVGGLDIEALENGLKGADYEGKGLRDIFPPEIYERDEPKLRATLNGEITDTISTFYGNYYRLITVPVRDDDDHIIAGIVMTQNITALKETEEALQKSEASYRTMATNFPNGIIALYDFDLRYTLADGQGFK